MSKVLFRLIPMLIVFGWANTAVGQCTAAFTITNNDPTVQVTDNSTGTFDTYQWDFGDGAGYYSTANPSHTYTTNGTYMITLTLYDSAGTGQVCSTDTQSVSITSIQTPNCVSDYSWFQDSTSYKVWFTDLSTGNIASWSWDFGDGDSSTLQNPEHTYNSTGKYFVTLTVDDGQGCTDTYLDSVFIQQLNVSCYSYWYEVVSQLQVSFYSYSGGQGLTYQWDFGDGNTSTQENPVHTYSISNQYNVCLTVTSSTGCSDTKCHPVSPNNNGQCNSQFQIVQDSANLSNYWLVNQSYGTNLTYLWDFGDGNTSTNQYATHTYANPGQYNICLTIDDGAGCTDQFCQTLTVNVRGGAFTVQAVDAGNLTNSIQEVENASDQLNLFPNPASNGLTINYSGVNKIESVRVYDLHGRLVLRESLSGMDRSTVLDVEGLQKGVYCVSVELKNGMEVVKRIIKD